MRGAASRHVGEWAVLSALLLLALVFALRGGWQQRADNGLYDSSAQGSRNGGGYGLGLALAQLVAPKHQATLVATPGEAGGLRISLHIVYIR